MKRSPTAMALCGLLLATHAASAQRQCLVAVSNAPPELLVAAIEVDGTLGALSSQGLPGASARLTGATRCGRFFYATTGTSIAGFELDDAGGVTALPGAAGSSDYSALACDEDAGLLFAGTRDPFSNTAVLESFTIGSDGGLLLADSVASSGRDVNGVDINPINGDVFFSVRVQGNPIGALGNDLALGRVAVGAAGAFGAVERVDVSTSSSPGLKLLRFTADGIRLALAGFTFVSFPFGGGQCFFHYEGPFTTLAALGARQDVCSGPLSGDAPQPGIQPSTFRGLAVRPEGGDLFYAHSEGLLRTGRFDATGVTPVTEIAPLEGGGPLLIAPGGDLLVSLGDGAVATYDVAADLETLTINDQIPLGAGPLVAGELLPCPTFPDQDGDGVTDDFDNCTEVPNPDQADIDAPGDDDSSLPGVQHYGDACDVDLDDDGIVGVSDFFAVLRPCIGVDPTQDPGCLEADLDGDGAVGSSDFFGRFRPALGTLPGPGAP